MVGKEEERPAQRVLTSWKEISAFLDVSTRTAQIWEKERGLPVERVGTGSRPRILAQEEALRAWLAKQGVDQHSQVFERPLRPLRKPHLAFFGILAASVLIVFLISLIPANVQPEGVQFVDSTLSVYGRNGKLLWVKSFDNPTAAPSVPNWDHDPIFRLMDVDDDGNIELLFSLVPLETGRAGKLICYNYNGSERWVFPFEFDKRFEGRRFQRFVGHAMDPVEIDGRTLLLVHANHVFWFPSMIGLLDPDTGELIDSYWHPGFVFRHLLQDIDEDGEKELLLGATNNPGPGIGYAALSVLELPFPPPKKDTFNIFGDPAGREKAYLLFPRPDVADALERTPFAQSVIAVSDDTIEVEVGGYSLPQLFYYFDNDLQIKDLVPSRNMSASHLELEESQLLDHSLSEAEIESWKNIQRFETAPNGNSAEVEAGFGKAN